MSFKKMAEIVEEADKKHLPMWKVVQLEDCKEQIMSEDESHIKMKEILSAMREADRNYNKDLTSKSGMAGGDGERIRIFNESGSSLVGGFISTVSGKQFLFNGIFVAGIPVNTVGAHCIKRVCNGNNPRFF